MSSFDQLVDDAASALLPAWDFSCLDGRAVEERPSWRYFDRVASLAATAGSLLEIQAGTGSMIGRLPSRPARSVAIEDWPASVAVAAPRLAARGIPLVVASHLPFRPASFDLVISRHPTSVLWVEIAEMLRPDGVYLAQHVGPESLRSLAESIVGPQPGWSRRAVDVETRAAEAAGLVVTMVNERPRTVFYDVGAVVLFLRLVPWIVPGFDVTVHRDGLRRLHSVIGEIGAFETTASRTLVEARLSGQRESQPRGMGRGRSL